MFPIVCNLLAFTLGNYSAGDVTQGVCLATAAQGPANNTFKSMPQVDIHQYSIIDGIGISQACNIHYDDEVQRICMCDSALPEYAWGRKIENRDPCGLERRANKDWIAAPVIGSVAIAIGIILSIILWHHKQKARLQRQDIPDEIALTSLRSCIVQSHHTTNGEANLTQRSAAGLDFSTPSQSSVQSVDSGVSLITPQSRRERKG